MIPFNSPINSLAERSLFDETSSRLIRAACKLTWQLCYPDSSSGDPDGYPRPKTKGREVPERVSEPERASGRALEPIVKVFAKHSHCRSGVAWQTVPRHVSSQLGNRVLGIVGCLYWFLDYRPRARKDLRDETHESPNPLCHCSRLVPGPCNDHG